MLGNYQPADFAGFMPSTIFAFHRRHHLKYDDLINLLHHFQLPRKTALPGFDEIMEDNRCFDDLKKCTNLADKHTHLR
jgi:hypothetical protein